MNTVGWFEIPVKDIDRATKFYENSLEVKLENSDMNGVKMAVFPMKENEAGAGGSLVQGKDYVPSNEGSRVYISCDDIEGTLKRIEDQGGKTINPKTSIGQYGFIAEFSDSEGNRVSLHSMK